MFQFTKDACGADQFYQHNERSDVNYHGGELIPESVFVKIKIEDCEDHGKCIQDDKGHGHTDVALWLISVSGLGYGTPAHPYTEKELEGCDDHGNDIHYQQESSFIDGFILNYFF